MSRGMKLERFYSDWNGQKSEVAYHDEPTKKQVTEALLGERVISGGRGQVVVIVASDNIVEVRTKYEGTISKNVYRDMYRILYADKK